jgi:hypothetical protein
MANGDVDVTEGSGLKVGSYTISEDAVTRHIQRVALNDSAGAEVAKAEDAAHSSGDKGIMALAVRQDSQTDFGADGDYVPLRVTGGGGLHVEIDSTQLGTLGQTTLAASVPVAPASDYVQKGAMVDDAAFTVASSYISATGFLADESSTDSVDEGDGGVARMTLDRKQIVVNQPHTAGGLSLFRSLDLDETEEDVKTSAGCLYKLRITNLSTSLRYVKIYNATAANVTVGTTTPVDTIVVPPAAASGATVITETFGGVGLTFDTAISMAATTGLADNDTGAPGANELVVSAYYK